MTNLAGNIFYNLRVQSGMNHRETAEFLGVSTRAVRRWDTGEVAPKKMALKLLETAANKARSRATYAHKGQSHFTFIDLFAGIGGIRLPFQELGGKCVFTSEWDKFSQITYSKNFGETPEGDITKIPSNAIPSHDVLLAGFPCQAFSQAGLKQGFLDTRGTMFFEIQRILSHHRPKAFVLENVKQLRGHDKGRTLQTIMDILRGKNKHDIPNHIQLSEETKKSLGDKLNYWVDVKVLRAADFGVPQNRERIFIVGISKDDYPNADFDSIFNWPKPSLIETRLGNILEENIEVDDKYTISDKLWAGHQRRKLGHKEKGNGFGYTLFDRDSLYANTISARYYKDGSEILINQSELGKNPRKLTPRECARLQGFPENFVIDCVSDTQSYKQFGNSVAVPVIRQVATVLLDALNAAEGIRKAA